MTKLKFRKTNSKTRKSIWDRHRYVGDCFYTGTEFVLDCTTVEDFLTSEELSALADLLVQENTQGTQGTQGAQA